MFLELLKKRTGRGTGRPKRFSKELPKANTVVKTKEHFYNVERVRAVRLTVTLSYSVT